MRYSVMGLVIGLLLLESLPAGAQSGTSAGASGTIPDDFLGLADLRGTLTGEIATLEKEIKEIEATVASEEDQKIKQEELQKTIDSLEKKPALNDREAEFLDFLRSQNSSLAADLRAIQRAKASLSTKQSALQDKRALANSVQKKIASLLNPEQQFKRTMSITFAVLIAFVIIGFFTVALRDDKIRQAIFSGQAGIQFLTLFSVVIAIILFGITGILEGKELAALLGGLSGYILGRATGAERPQSPDHTA